MGINKPSINELDPAAAGIRGLKELKEKILVMDEKLSRTELILEIDNMITKLNAIGAIDHISKTQGGQL